MNEWTQIQTNAYPSIHVYTYLRSFIHYACFYVISNTLLVGKCNYIFDIITYDLL